VSIFEIKLDKTDYNAGEIVTGKLLTSTGRDLQLGDLKFSAFGAEFITISGKPKGLQPPQIDPVSNSDFEEFNVLFSKDLSGFLHSALEQNDDPSLTSTTTVKIPKGNLTIPFEFTIPQDALQSYQGKHVHVIYKVKVGAMQHRPKRDLGKCLIFRIRNPKTCARDKNKASALEDKEQYAHLPANDSGADVMFDLNGKSEFVRGRALDGRLVIKNLDTEDVRGIWLSLRGIEYATAYAKTVRFKKETVIQQYDQSIAASKMKDGMESITFTFHIPQEAQISYVGKHSEFYWVLAAKLDVARGRDIVCRMKIQLVSRQETN